MIYESWSWKRDLLKDADLIERWATKPDTSRRSIIFEKKIFLTAFSARKLVEARRLSTDFSRRSVKVRLFPATGVNVNRLNNHKFDKQYRLDGGLPRNLAATRLIDIIIHSYTFVESLSEEGAIDAFWIASDKTKASGLYEIKISEYVSLLRSAGHDNPEMTRYRFNEDSGEYDVWKGPEPKASR